MMAEKLRLLKDEALEKHVRANFSSAGVLPISPDFSHVLLGAHSIEQGPLLWGPFAGSRSGGEKPEETALREAKEEGLPENVELYPPTVLITKRAKSRIGIIFPTILGYDVGLQIPNEEIAQARWFDWARLTELKDEADQAGRFWGGIYTYYLLWLWEDIDGIDRRHANRPLPQLLAEMNRVLSLVYYPSVYESISPYVLEKQKERSRKSA